MTSEFRRADSQRSGGGERCTSNVASERERGIPPPPVVAKTLLLAFSVAAAAAAVVLQRTVED